MNVYSIDVAIVATAYIKAEDEAEALKIAQRDLTGRSLEFTNDHQSCGEGICVDGRPYECLADNREETALSPAMTVSSLLGAVSFVENI